MAKELFVHQLPNGLALLGERQDHVVSTAVNIALPAGASHDGRWAGAGTVLSDWLFRGAGPRDTRQLDEAFDFLGCHHDENVHSAFLQLSASQTHQNLRAVLELLADVVQRPHLTAAAFDPCRKLALQELAGLEDEPTRKCNLRLRERFYPAPLGASPLGHADTLAAMTDADLRAHAADHLTPAGGIFSVAGRFDFGQLREWVAELFGGWAGPVVAPAETAPAARGVTFEPKPTAQTQIALAWPAPPIGDAHYYPLRVAEMVLSGGMSGRLFTEVREKRGLVYSVGARYQGLRGVAGMFAYAGTAPDRAQQTLEVTVAELRRLGEGVTAEELTRAKVQLKSSLIMHGESTAARAAALASDWYLLGRPRTLEEVAEAVDRVSLDDVAAGLAAWPARDFTAYFIGPKELDTSCLG